MTTQFTEADLFNNPRKQNTIEIQRYQNQDSNNRCIFLYVFNNQADAMVQKTETGEVEFTIDEYQFCAVGVDHVQVLKWIAETAILMMKDFEKFWKMPRDRFELPQLKGWQIEIDPD